MATARVQVARTRVPQSAVRAPVRAVAHRATSACRPAEAPCEAAPAAGDNKQPVGPIIVPHSATRRAVMMMWGTMMWATPRAEAAVAPAAAGSKAQFEMIKGLLMDQMAGNVDAVLQRQAKGVVWRLPAAFVGDPLGGQFDGKRGVLVYLTRQGAQTRDLQLKDLKLQEAGRNEVIAQYRLSGRMVASNSRFSTSVTQVWHLAVDGAVERMTAYYDTSSLAKAAGIKKATAD